MTKFIKNQVKLDNIPTPLFPVDFYSQSMILSCAIILSIVVVVFIVFVCIFIVIQIKTICTSRDKIIKNDNKGENSSKKESFLTRDVVNPSVLKVTHN